MPQNYLLGLDIHELTGIAERVGEPGYRGRQLFHAIYRQRAASLNDISTLSKEFRAGLIETTDIGLPLIDKKFTSTDGTVRYLMKLSDGETVETVWMPDGDDGEAGDGSDAGVEAENNTTNNWHRSTICVSSQVGCAVNCHFCLTALLGIKRNLTAGEIVGQVIAILNDQNVSPPEERINLVFMGMGEPFLNYENFIKAVRLLVDGVGVAESRMTVSTAGIIPRIADLGKEPVRPKLAISLTAANDELRNQLMPINRKWNLEKLMVATREFPLRNREKLTFEYVLLADVNDSVRQASELAELLRGMKAKVNLIALNPGPGIDFKTPDTSNVLNFQQVLIKSGIPAFIRRPRGRDIYAACGQLKRTTAAT